MKTETDTEKSIEIDREEANFHYDVDYKHDAGRGLTEETIDYISNVKDEDDWVREFRKRALKVFNQKEMPTHWAEFLKKNEISWLESRLNLIARRRIPM